MPARKKKKRAPKSHAIVDAERAAFARGLMAVSALDETTAQERAAQEYPYPRSDHPRIIMQAATAVWRDVVKTVGIPYGVATYLHPLVREHGMPQVMAWWRDYLEQGKSRPQFLTARAFAAQPDRWGPPPPASVVNADGTLTTAGKQAYAGRSRE